MSDNTVKVTVTEKDKPFILALVAAGITAAVIVLDALGKITVNFETIFTFSSTLTAAGFGYYFAKKE